MKNLLPTNWLWIFIGVSTILILGYQLFYALIEGKIEALRTGHVIQFDKRPFSFIFTFIIEFIVFFAAGVYLVITFRNKK